MHSRNGAEDSPTFRRQIYPVVSLQGFLIHFPIPMMGLVLITQHSFWWNKMMQDPGSWLIYADTFKYMDPSAHEKAIEILKFIFKTVTVPLEQSKTTVRSLNFNSISSEYCIYFQFTTSLVLLLEYALEYAFK